MFRRHRGSPGRSGALPRPLLQVLPRHGLAGRHVPEAGLRRPLLQDPTEEVEKLVPEGIEAACLTRVRWWHRDQLMGGLRSSMGYTGSKESRPCVPGRSSCASPAGMRESHVHDVTINQGSA